VFERVTIWAADREASERFYGLVLRTLGTEQSRSDARDARWGVLIVRSSDEANPPTQRVHLGFTAQSRGRVDEFWRIGTGGGYRDDGQPGLRPEYGPDYYGGFLLDPDGNSAEAVHHDDVPAGANVDHLWIRVADLEAAVRFYDTIAPHAGLQRGVSADEPTRRQFLDAERVSFSLVAGGEPTEHVHVAFPTDDDAAVHGFHEAATSAGYRDNGPPGERPEYHAGYYAAFALDPDGNNVEVVNHHRP
jgi:catechol 2,3-dioxygenase-like lactoylglutathione lyase family enzyme